MCVPQVPPQAEVGSVPCMLCFHSHREPKRAIASPQWGGGVLVFVDDQCWARVSILESSASAERLWLIIHGTEARICSVHGTAHHRQAT